MNTYQKFLDFIRNENVEFKFDNNDNFNVIRTNRYKFVFSKMTNEFIEMIQIK